MSGLKNHLRVTEVRGIHSSTVQINLSSPHGESSSSTMVLTLDFCIWDLYKERVILSGSDSDDPEAGLSCLIGCDLIKIRMIEEIWSGLETPVYLNILFTGNYRIAVGPHDSESDVPEEKYPLITISRNLLVKQYFSDGSVEFIV